MWSGNYNLTAKTDRRTADEDGDGTAARGIEVLYELHAVFLAFPL